MKQGLLAVILVGATRANSMCNAMGRSVVSLPVGRGVAILDGWLGWLERLNCPVDIVLATRECPSDGFVLRRDSVRNVRDPSKWRGTAGVLLDIFRMPGQQYCTVLAIEGACLPPQGSHAMLEAIQVGATVAVGASEDREPAGVFALASDAFEYVPRIGYFDLKEQLLPRLRENDHVIKCVDVTDQAIRIDSRESYLHAVDAWSRRQRGVNKSLWMNDGAPTMWTGRAIGPCVVEAGADVAVDAVLHDSVVLDGARVECGAVVSRSVVTANGVVRSGETVTRRIVLDDGERYRRAAHAWGSMAGAGAIHTS